MSSSPSDKAQPRINVKDRRVVTHALLKDLFVCQAYDNGRKNYRGSRRQIERTGWVLVNTRLTLVFCIKRERNNKIKRTAKSDTDIGYHGDSYQFAPISSVKQAAELELNDFHATNRKGLLELGILQIPGIQTLSII